MLAMSTHNPSETNYHCLRIPIMAWAAPKSRSIMPPTPQAGVISGWIGRPPVYFCFVPSWLSLSDPVEPSNEGIVVATKVEWLVFEEVVSFVVLVVAMAVAVAVVAVPLVLGVLAVDVELGILSVAVAVASGSALFSTVVKASTFRSATSTAGADNATPKRSTKIKVLNNDHRILYGSMPG